MDGGLLVGEDKEKLSDDCDSKEVVLHFRAEAEAAAARLPLF